MYGELTMAETPPPDIQATNMHRTACPKCAQVVDVSQVPPFETVECDHCHSRFAAPGMLGPYVLLKHLGKGEMGLTFKAYEKAMGRHVAVKVLRKSLCDEATLVDGFFSEARALASLDHPNIARGFSVGEAQGQPYIVMELVDGKAMDKLFTPEAPLDEHRAIEIGMGVGEALQAATGKGLIHSDVKPANILINAAGVPKLVDFGIARFGGGRLGARDAIGTPYYLAPEQVLRESIDLRTDIYGLGATLFHAIAGVPPFAGTKVKDVMGARLTGPAPDLRSLRQDIHPETAAVIARMLERDPARRYGDYESLLNDLRRAKDICAASAPAGRTPAGRGQLDLVSQALTSKTDHTRRTAAGTKHGGPSRHTAARRARRPTGSSRTRQAKRRIRKQRERSSNAVVWIISATVIMIVVLVIVLVRIVQSRS